ncbi:MAG: hypothetical protein HQL37_05455 [Alphaproteobacteria bacterium]|nr:hypothetical protein [Alphaproteobacteria bacterium]
MSPLPTMSLRAAPEHHALLRDIARAIRTRPELVDAIQDAIRRDTPGDVPQRNIDEGVLRDVIRRISEHDDVLRTLTQRVDDLAVEPAKVPTIVTAAEPPLEGAPAPAGEPVATPGTDGATPQEQRHQLPTPRCGRESARPAD